MDDKPYTSRDVSHTRPMDVDQRPRLPPLSSLLSHPSSTPSVGMHRPDRVSTSPPTSLPMVTQMNFGRGSPPPRTYPAAAAFLPHASDHSRVEIGRYHDDESSRHQRLVLTDYDRNPSTSASRSIHEDRLNAGGMRYESDENGPQIQRISPLHSTHQSISPPNLKPPLTSFNVLTGGRSPPAPAEEQAYTGRSFHPPNSARTAPHHSPLLSAQRESDRFSTEASTASSSSARASFHPIRMRRRWSYSPYENPPSPSAMETFNKLWDILLLARRYNESIRGAAPSAGPRPLPSIRDGDIATLSTHLQYEIDLLFERDPRTAEQLAQEARTEQLHHRQQQHQKPQSHYAYQNVRRSPPFAYAPTSSHTHGGEGIQRSPNFARPGLEQEPFFPGYESRRDVPSPDKGYTSRPGTAAYPPMHDSRPHGGYSSSFADPRHPFSHTPGPPKPISAFGQPTGTAAASSMPRRVRKRQDEAEQTCLCCSASETPEWRKGPTGPRTLCNACGLLFAKQCRKREMELQASGKRPKGSRISGPEDMTLEEREKSLLELQMAVQARANQIPSLGPGPSSTGPMSSALPSGTTQSGATRSPPSRHGALG